MKEAKRDLNVPTVPSAWYILSDESRYPFTLRVTGIIILPVTYFPTNLVYAFTLRVTGIT